MAPVREGPRSKRVHCPVIAGAWVSPTLVAVGGGGGRGAKSGVPNHVMLCRVRGGEVALLDAHAALEDATVALAAVPRGRGALLLAALEAGGASVLEVAEGPGPSDAPAVRVDPSRGVASGSPEDPLGAPQLGSVSLLRASDSGERVVACHLVPALDPERSYLTVLDAGLRQVGRVSGLVAGEAKDVDVCPHRALGGDHESLLAVVDDACACHVLDWRTGGDVRAAVSLEGTPLAAGQVRRARFARASAAPVLLALVVLRGDSFVARFAVARDPATRALSASYLSHFPAVNDLCTALDVGREEDTCALGTGEGEVSPAPGHRAGSGGSGTAPGRARDRRPRGLLPGCGREHPETPTPPPRPRRCSSSGTPRRGRPAAWSAGGSTWG